MALRVLYEKRFLCKQNEDEFLASYTSLCHGRDAAQLRVKLRQRPSLGFVITCLRLGVELFFDSHFTRKRPYEACVLPKYQFLRISGDSAALDDRYTGLLKHSGLPDVYVGPRADLVAALTLAQTIRLEWVDLRALREWRSTPVVRPFILRDGQLETNSEYVYGNYFRVTTAQGVHYVADEDYEPQPGAIVTLFPHCVRLKGATLYAILGLVADGKLAQDLFEQRTKKVALRPLRVDLFGLSTLTIKQGGKFGPRMFV